MNDPMLLGRRERQIMEVVYTLGRATVNDVMAAIPDAPSRVSIRTMMRILEEKGHLTHSRQGKEYIYRPTRPRAQVAKGVFRRLLDTFFGGSIERALASYLSDPRTELSEEELNRLQALIEKARKDGVQ